jgi:hypothetical protein
MAQIVPSELRGREGRTPRVLVLLLPNVHLQDMAGPVQVFDEAAQVGGGYRLVFCGVERRVRSAQGLELADLEPLPTVLPADLVLVPGMASATQGRAQCHHPGRAALHRPRTGGDDRWRVCGNRRRAERRGPPPGAGRRREMTANYMEYRWSPEPYLVGSYAPKTAVGPSQGATAAQ